MSLYLPRHKTLLLVIDIQERLARIMDRCDQTVESARRAIEGARILGMPVVVTEQYPRGLGHTVEELAPAMQAASARVLEKIRFSALDDELRNILTEGQYERILVCGMETHICVFQTVRDLSAAGHQIHVLQDAVCSRDEENRRNGLELARTAGAVVSNLETALFDLLGEAGTDEFKAISRLIK